MKDQNKDPQPVDTGFLSILAEEFIRVARIRLQREDGLAQRYQKAVGTKEERERLALLRNHASSLRLMANIAARTALRDPEATNRMFECRTASQKAYILLANLTATFLLRVVDRDDLAATVVPPRKRTRSISAAFAARQAPVLADLYNPDIGPAPARHI